MMTLERDPLIENGDRDQIPSKLVLFDGVCNLCNGFIQFILRNEKDPNLKFASLQSAFGQTMIERFGIDTKKVDSIVFIKKGKVHYKSRAIFGILRHLKFPWRLLLIFGIIPPFLVDPVYRLIARNRYRMFGKRDECWLPTPELKARFLEENIL